MLFTQDREKLRRFYLETWQKAQQKLPLEPLEEQLIDVVKMHPEYHKLLDADEKTLGREWLPEMGETNPFLHLGMHLAIREQLATDRPVGIRDLTRSLLQKLKDGHETEHQMMECLGEMLWQAQRERKEPNETGYMNCLRGLLLGTIDSTD